MNFLKRFVLLLLIVCLAFFLSSCTDQKQVYEDALQLFEQGEFLAAAEKLESIPGYEDAADLARYCEALAAASDGDYAAAADLLDAVPAEYRDASQRKIYYEAIAMETIAEVHDARLDAAALFDTVPGFLDADDRAYALRMQVFEEASALLEAGEFDEAYAWLEKLGTFNGADGIILESKYARGEQSVEAGDLQFAWELFSSLNDYRDSMEKCRGIRYLQGVESMNAGKMDEAYIFFKEAGDWQDAAEQAVVCMEMVAAHLASAGDPAQALAIYVLTGNTEKLYETIYAMAGHYALQGNNTDAARLYRLLGDYSDSAAKLASLPETDEAGQVPENTDNPENTEQVMSETEKKEPLAVSESITLMNSPFESQ